MAIFVILKYILHTISVFYLRSGKIIDSEKDITIFGVSLAYIITILICGF
jgi:hypothetical protein